MLRVYIGWDPRDEMAFRACVASLRAHSSIPLEIIPLRDHELRARGLYWRSYHVEPSGQMIDDREQRPFSTQFSFTRFAIPLLDSGDDWALFCDADMFWRADVAQLLALAADDKDLMCVQHLHEPPETVKMDGVEQLRYLRKNWSSLFLLRPGKCPISRYTLNTGTGIFLHGFLWVPQDRIGALPESWNWLEGWSAREISPDVVHYTRGVPNMLGNHLPFAEEWWAAARAWQPGMNREGLT